MIKNFSNDDLNLRILNEIHVNAMVYCNDVFFMRFSMNRESILRLIYHSHPYTIPFDKLIITDQDMNKWISSENYSNNNYILQLNNSLKNNQVKIERPCDSP